MLERFDKEKVRVTLRDGAVLRGVAEALPSGYGLHEFGRQEELLEIEGTTVFLSEIQGVERLGKEPKALPDDLGGFMGDLLEGPYAVVDVLPRQVPRAAPGQYFAVERFWRSPERLGRLRRKFADILLRLNCYRDMAVSFDNCETWQTNPDPESFAERLSALSGNTFLRAIFAGERTMVDIDPCDTFMTAFGAEGEFLRDLEMLAAAEGLFVWEPVEG